MGRHSVIEKLDKEILKQIKTEAQVVYLLVEVRKVITEHDISQDNKYPILSFFCDWVVHAKMDRQGATSMLNVIQDFYRGLDGYLHIKKTTSFFPFVMLIVLRRELGSFLKRNSLPLELVDNRNYWERFLFLLINVLIDCPLVANGGYIREFKFTGYKSKDNLSSELTLQDNSKQEFESKSQLDFIEEDYSSYVRIT